MKKAVFGSLLSAGLLAVSVPVMAEEAAPAVAPVAPEAVEVFSADAVVAVLPEIVGKVNGKNATREDVKNFLLSQTEDGKLPPQLTPEVMERIGFQIVQNYLIQTMLLAEAANEDIVASKENALKELSNQLKDIPPQQLEMLKQQLNSGEKPQTIEEYLSSIAEKPMVQQQIAVKTLLDKKVVNAINVDEELKKFYEEHKEDPNMYEGDDEGMLSASHILVAYPDGEDGRPAAPADEAAKAEYKAKAQAAFDRLKAGEKFEDVAMDVSDCPSGDRGGNLGSFAPQQMVPAFSEAVQKLEVGTYSEPVETEFGYHIILRNPLKPKRQLSFEEFCEIYGNDIKGQKIAEAVEEYIANQSKLAELENAIPVPQMPEFNMAPAGNVAE